MKHEGVFESVAFGLKGSVAESAGQSGRGLRVRGRDNSKNMTRDLSDSGSSNFFAIVHRICGLSETKIVVLKSKLTLKKMVYLTIAVALVVIVGVGWRMTARTSYESAAYSVVESDGPVEIREYPDLMLVTTPMRSQGSDGSFGRLFRFISGGNENDLKVAMTTPVFMKPEGLDTAGQMGFVVAESVSSQRIPNPTDKAVQIKRRDGGRFAVIRFSGRMDEEPIAENEEKLRKWIVAKGLSESDGFEFAGYDPPWTPNPFRRNEILIRLK